MVETLSRVSPLIDCGAETDERNPRITERSGLGQIPPTLHRFDNSIDPSSARNADDECIKGRRSSWIIPGKTSTH